MRHINDNLSGTMRHTTTFPSSSDFTTHAILTQPNALMWNEIEPNVMPCRNLRQKVVLNEITFTVIHIKMWCLELLWPTLFESGGGLRGGSLVHSLTSPPTGLWYYMSLFTGGGKRAAKVHKSLTSGILWMKLLGYSSSTGRTLGRWSVRGPRTAMSDIKFDHIHMSEA